MLKTQLGDRVVPICLKATFSFGTLAAAGRLEIAGPPVLFGGPRTCALGSGWILQPRQGPGITSQHPSRWISASTSTLCHSSSFSLDMS